MSQTSYISANNTHITITNPGLMPQLTRNASIRDVDLTRVKRGGWLEVHLHDTPVVRIYHAENGNIHVSFRHNGWTTATTKTRMNQALTQFGLPLQVIMARGDWKVRYELPSGSMPEFLHFDFCEEPVYYVLYKQEGIGWTLASVEGRS